MTVESQLLRALFLLIYPMHVRQRVHMIHFGCVGPCLLWRPRPENRTRDFGCLVCWMAGRACVSRHSMNGIPRRMAHQPQPYASYAARVNWDWLTPSKLINRCNFSPAMHTVRRLTLSNYTYTLHRHNNFSVSNQETVASCLFRFLITKLTRNLS